MYNQQISSVVAQWGAMVDCRAVAGGCISDAAHVTVRGSSGGQAELFVKSNRADFEQNFRCEFDGLRRLADVNMIRTVEPLKIETIGDTVFMVMQWIETAGKSDFEQFGRQLANLHRQSSSCRIGLEYDNFLGASPQINSPTVDWVQFVQNNRIEAQLRLTANCGLNDAKFKRDIEAVIDSMPTLLAGRENTTSLLHGDLWRGNYLFDESNRPVIIDPAIYYGCREAEFGMLLLLGGCPQSFYDAYNDQWPLPPGWRQRCKVYVLYHLLNHLNLFGASYLGQCKQVAHEILSDGEL
jgi:protein-ribulosamine 3-kinase